MKLIGGRAECGMLDRLVEAVCAGQSRALVLSGDAGVGKAALLQHVVRRATECRVVQVAGVESEMELAFAGLHQLCAPLPAGLEKTPDEGDFDMMVSDLLELATALGCDVLQYH
jgi:hypothetical protein